MAQPTAQSVDALLHRSDIDGLEPIRHVHQHNANAIRLTRSLSSLTGLETLGVHLVSLTQGRFSTEYHRHHEDEEFIYILSGCGLARIGAHQHDVAPGDFMGFNTRAEAHSLYNPHPEDLFTLWAALDLPSIFAIIPTWIYGSSGFTVIEQRSSVNT